MIHFFVRMIYRDLALAMRKRAEVVVTLFFFMIAVSLFPLALGPESLQNKAMLRQMGPIIIWVAALLASMLSLNHLFANDYQDGTLEQLMLIPQPLSLMVLSKVVAHWMTSGLPLVLLSPLLGMQLFLSRPEQEVLVLSLLMGTPILSLIGAVGAGLTLGLRNGGILVSLLVLPLYIPVMIFGAGAVVASQGAFGPQAYLSYLAALLTLAVVFIPWAGAMALRVSLE